jgi:hypothetical protein
MMHAFSKDDFAFWGLRISLALTFWMLIVTQVNQYPTAPMPHGIWSWALPQSPIPYYTPLFWIISGLSVLGYARKHLQKWAPWALFVLTTWAVCMEESNGIHNRNALISWLFLAQAIAATWEKNSSKTALQYSAQVVAGTYLLSGLSKVFDAGLSWPIQGQRIGLQIAKSFHQAWADLLNPEHLQAGIEQLAVLDQYKSILPSILAAALMLELCAPLALINSRTMISIGVLLVVMHLGIFITMNISLLGIAIPMFWVFINPVGWLLSLRRPT